MSFDYFLKYIKTNCDTTGINEAEIKPHFTSFKCAQNTSLLTPGEVCRHIYFIEKGLVRTYFSEGLEEKTSNFYGTAAFLSAPTSFHQQIASKEGIICENEVSGVQISYEELHQRLARHPVLSRISLWIFSTMLVESHKQFNNFCRTTGAERFDLVHDTHPKIANIVLQKDIASFIGVTQSHYSTLKRRKN